MPICVRSSKLAIAGAVLCAAGVASADTLVFDLTREFSGATPPSGSGPWLRATFTDTGSDTVSLTLENLLSNNEFVSRWYFNVDPALLPGDPDNLNWLDVTYDGSSGPEASVFKEENSFKADGDGYFDLSFEWTNSGSGRFGAGSSDVVYTLSGAGLTAMSFNFLSLGAGNSPDGLLSAAHIQGIGKNGEDSGWITTVIIPLPSAASLGLLGLCGIGMNRRRALP